MDRVEGAQLQAHQSGHMLCQCARCVLVRQDVERWAEAEAASVEAEAASVEAEAASVEAIFGRLSIRVGDNLPANGRKRIPMATGLLDLFPKALAKVAELSATKRAPDGNVAPLHKHPAADDADALVRHLADRGTLDTNGHRHSTEVAWRALAMLQHEIEERGE